MSAAVSRRSRPPRTLKQRAVALLARREYARCELHRRLASTGAPSEEIDAVLDELSAAGLLSDTRFAAALVHRKAGGYGRRAIVHALREKGIGAVEANEALVELDGNDELEMAHALWTRRFGTPPRDERDKARQFRFLLARGYSQSIALKVLRSAALSIREDDA